MEPDVRYCTTSDGLRIAYTVTGSGPPIVYFADPTASHVQLEWAHPTLRQVLTELAHYNTLIRFDPHGSGLSDRTLDFSTEAFVRDLLAVTERLGIQLFALAAVLNATPLAIAFAGAYPERVNRLVLVDAYARMTDMLATPQARALLTAVQSDWEVATEAVGTLVFGPGRAESGVQGAYVRACIAPDYWADPRAFAGIDASSLLERCSMPTLILRHAGVRIATEEMSRDIASRVPDARMTTLEGAWADDPVGMGARIAAFVNGDEFPNRPPSEGERSGVRTILFTDMVGHTEMMRRLGDERGRAVLHEHERITRDAIKRYNGTEVKTDGDSFMVSFSSVAAATECAVSMQRGFAQWSAHSEEALVVRMGLNAGEPVEEAGDLFGESVILASRIAAQASGGEILIPEPVRHLLAGKGFIFADRGMFVPKGFEDALHLYAVRWQE